MPRHHHVPRVLLLIETVGSFGPAVIRGIGRYALENGPWSIQFEHRALDSLPPQWLKQWKGDGVISRTVNVTQARALRRTKVPVVELHGNPKVGVPHVRIDVAAEGRMVVDYFLNCGLREFAFFAYGDAWWIDWHRDAFCGVLKERGYGCHEYRPPIIKRNLPSWHESQRPGLIEWLHSLPRPIGVLTPGDLHSARLLDMCHELDIAVPEEIAILGLCNDPVICETVRPTLSSVDVDARRIGYEGARLLDQMMAGKKVASVICVPPSHVVARQSTDLVAIGDADIAQAVRIIRERACTNIDVSSIAEQIGLSRRALERRFRQHLGRSPKAEIMRMQIERAKTLLAQTDTTSEGIARKCGFSSIEYFTRVFRRKVGMKPQAYRKARRVARDLDRFGEN
jgi:LacI family transcriptional regulator